MHQQNTNITLPPAKLSVGTTCSRSSCKSSNGSEHVSGIGTFNSVMPVNEFPKILRQYDKPKPSATPIKATIPRSPRFQTATHTTPAKQVSPLIEQLHVSGAGSLRKTKPLAVRSQNRGHDGGPENVASFVERLSRPKHKPVAHIFRTKKADPPLNSGTAGVRVEIRSRSSSATRPFQQAIASGSSTENAVPSLVFTNGY